MRSFAVDFNPDRDVTLQASLFDLPRADEDPGSLEYPRPAVIVCPGGAYQFLSQREADPVVVAFQRYGFHAFTLRYSVREHAVFPNPAVDAARAVRWVRGHAGELGVDPNRIVLLGFSAGGHVTALLGTHWHRDEVIAAERAEYEALVERGIEANAGLLEHSSRPDAIVPCYAVFSLDWLPMDDELTGMLKEDCVAAVTDQVPPAFVWTTGGDTLVPPTQSLRFVNALSEAGVPFEYHHFAHGPHGLGVADATSNADRDTLPENAGSWVELCARWLRATLG